MNHLIEVGTIRYIVTTVAYTPEVRAIRSKKYGRGKTPASVIIHPQVTAVQPDGTETMTTFADFKQAYADARCAGNLDEAQEEIESTMIAANHRASPEYKLKMRRARRRIFSRNAGRGRGRG